MTNDRRTKRLPHIILNQFLVGLLMATVAASVLFFAEGYRFNVKNFKIIKTGVLYLSSQPKSATIYINDKKLKGTTPFAKNLTAGTYSAKVELAGYKTWSTSFRIDSGLVSEFDQIILFKENPEISNLSDQRKINYLNSPVENLAILNSKNYLEENGYEIWQNNVLVTRFSEPVDSVLWYPGLKNILYQQGDEIRIIEISGANDTLLVKLSGTDSTRYMVNNAGDELYYLDGDQYKMARIR